MPREPECRTTQTIPASSRHTSKKWLPEPSVPNCTSTFRSCLEDSATGQGLAANHRSAAGDTRSCHLPSPAGMTSDRRARYRSRSSGSSDSSSDVCTAIIPHPMSTPTAEGITAPSVGITEPTVAPIPRCASGMSATWVGTIGSRAAFRACSIVTSSSTDAHASSLSSSRTGMSATR